MSTPEQLTAQRAMSEIAAAERLAERFADALESGIAAGDVFTPDVVFNGDTVREDVRIVVLRTIPTISGFVTEHEEHREVEGVQCVARRLWLCEVRGGRIVEAVSYDCV